MSSRVSIDFEVNGRRHSEEIAPNTVLLDLLRDRYDLTGVKASCERGVCGACTILIDGTPAASCSVFAFSVDGAAVETINRPHHEDGLGAVQQAFAECGGFQCGYCTPGMIMVTTALLREHPAPDDEQIRSRISSNVCRCTGYQTIIESVRRAAELRRKEQPVMRPAKEEP